MASNKGSAFERALCKKLSLWSSKGANDFVYWRSSGSGSLATMRAKKGKKAAGHEGDLTAVHPYGNIVLKDITIEAKNGYGQVSPLDAIDVPEKNKTRVFEGFIEQCLRECEESNKKYFWLVFKRDRRNATITVPKAFIDKYCELFGNLTCNRLILRYNGLQLITMDLDWFLNWFDPEVAFGPYVDEE